MLSEFDKLVQQRSELMNWWRIGSTIAAYDNRNHVLRVDMQQPSMVTFCGQAYAGARNYHDAPAWFAECVRHEQQERANEITEAAYEKALASLDERIEKHRTAVEEALSRAR